MPDDFFLPEVELREILEHTVDELTTADRLFLTNVNTLDLMYLIRRFGAENLKEDDETIESFINKHKGGSNGQEIG